VTWNVRATPAATSRTVAYRPGYADFRGTLRFDDLFAFLRVAKKITGDEWFNGVAFGVEPQRRRQPHRREVRRHYA
jgi:hypothetical protein